MNEVSIQQLEYIKSRTRHKRCVSLLRVLIFVVFIALWQFCASNGIIDSFIFSSPAKICICFITMLREQSLITHIFVTLFETIVSFILVIVLGTAVAVLLWCNEKLAQVLEPYLVILNSLPKSALAPLLIVWLGANVKTIIVAGISVAIFGTIINLFTSFCEVDPDKIKLIYTLGGKKLNVLFKVILPNSVPAIISTMKVNIGLALVGVIIGEFIGARSGLGYLIIYGSQVFKLDWVLMSISILCVLSVLLYKIINLLEKAYLKRL